MTILGHVDFGERLGPRKCAPPDAEHMLLICLRLGARSAAGMRQRVTMASVFSHWTEEERAPLTTEPVVARCVARLVRGPRYLATWYSDFF